MDFEGIIKVKYTDEDGNDAYKSVDFVFVNHSKEAMDRLLNAVKKTIQEIQEESLLNTGEQNNVTT